MSLLSAVARHYDPACPHEAAHGGLAAAVDGAPETSILLVSGAGCSSRMHAYLDVPCIAAPFGRGPSVARGLLLAQPAAVPVVYAGEGELIGEGLADLVRAAAADAPVLVVSVGGLGDTPGTCALASGDRQGTSLDPVTLLAPFGGFAREIASDQPEALASAFSEALKVVGEGRKFALLRVIGSCPAVGWEG